MKSFGKNESSTSSQIIVSVTQVYVSSKVITADSDTITDFNLVLKVSKS